MLLPMLKAVKDMIYFPTGDEIIPEIPREVVNAKIECARVILSEIINGLDNVSTGSYTIENPKPVFKIDTSPKPEPLPKATLEPKPTVETTGEKEWMITLDDNKGLNIIDFPLDGLIELDGKKMTYKEARGQTFKKARIL